MSQHAGVFFILVHDDLLYFIDMKNILKSIGAVLAAFIAVGVVTTATDYVFEPFLGIASVSISLVFAWMVIYRFIYDTLGCYLVARLAPNHPIRHVWIVGILGLVIGLTGTILLVGNPAAGPLWYGIVVALSSLLSAWLGARLYLKDPRNRVATK